MPAAAAVASVKGVIIMRSNQVVSVIAVIIMTAVVHPAWARQDPAVRREGPVAMSAIGGASLGSGHAGAAAGLTLSVDLSDRVALEGRSVYFDRGPGQSAMDVNASVLVDLLVGRRVVPYVSLGGGLYRAMFDLGNQRFSGMMGQFTAGTHTTGMGGMPTFYAGRVAALAAPTAGRWHMQGFTDPAVSVGGGLRLDLTNRVYVRPDVRAVSVVGGGDTYTIGSFTLSVGYRF